VALPVIDLHEDVSTYFISGGFVQEEFGRDARGRQADVPKYLRGNVRLVFAAIFPGSVSYDLSRLKATERIYGSPVPAVRFHSPQASALHHVKVYYAIAEAHAEVFIVERVKDVEAAVREGGRVGFVLSLEGADALDEPYDLKLLYRLGIRCVGLTWNYNNRYGAACGSRRDYGLTPDGEELVRTANELGVIVDVAHASKRTAVEAIEASKRPAIVSHGNVRRLRDTPRNVDDEVLEALSRRGGVVGISAVGPLISDRPRPSLDDLVRHFTYVRETFGPDVLAIGTDFLGTMNLPVAEGFESIDRVQLLLEKLGEAGFGDADLRKVAYENALRVLREHAAAWR